MQEELLNTSQGLGVYALSSRCMCLSSLSTSSQVNHRFIVGSFEDSENNEVRVLDFNEDTKEVSSVITATGFPPIKDLVSASKEEDQLRLFLGLYYTRSKDYSVELLELNVTGELKRHAIETRFKNLRNIATDPHSEKIVVVTRSSLSLQQSEEGKYKNTASYRVKRKFSIRQGKELLRVEGEPKAVYNVGRYYPHHPDIFATSNVDRFELVDFRQKLDKRVNLVGGSVHLGSILDLDFNPNVPNELVTAGEDNQIIYWDIRSVKNPTLTYEADSKHWITRISYNLYHDQLLLTCQLDDISLYKKDTEVRKLLNFNDKIVNISWSELDAWHYAFLKRKEVVVNAIPSSIKYKLIT